MLFRYPRTTATAAIETSPRPYFQHLLVAFDSTGGLHRALGGTVVLELNLVLSQVGPLVVVGLFGRRKMSLAEIGVRERSRLRAGGGTVTPIQRWLVGTEIVGPLAGLLIGHESWAKRETVVLGRKIEAKRAKGGDRPSHSCPVR